MKVSTFVSESNVKHALITFGGSADIFVEKDEIERHTGNDPGELIDVNSGLHAVCLNQYAGEVWALINHGELVALAMQKDGEHVIFVIDKLLVALKLTYDRKQNVIKRDIVSGEQYDFCIGKFKEVSARLLTCFESY